MCQHYLLIYEVNTENAFLLFSGPLLSFNLIHGNEIFSCASNEKRLWLEREKENKKPSPLYVYNLFNCKSVNFN